MPDITLLLVDDEVAFRKLLSKELAHAGGGAGSMAPIMSAAISGVQRAGRRTSRQSAVSANPTRAALSPTRTLSLRDTR
jgi:hypothetical protein